MKKTANHASAWPRHLFLIGTSEPMPKAGKDSKDSKDGLEAMGSKAWHLLRMARLVRYRREGKNVHYALDDDHVLHIIREAQAHFREER